jgi:hypothetical protein
MPDMADRRARRDLARTGGAGGIWRGGGGLGGIWRGQAGLEGSGAAVAGSEGSGADRRGWKDLARRWRGRC